MARSLDSVNGVTMTARWRRLRPRDMALFVAVAAMVAVVVVIVGRELDIGREAAAVREVESIEPAAERADSDLSLTLTRRDSLS